MKTIVLSAVLLFAGCSDAALSTEDAGAPSETSVAFAQVVFMSASATADCTDVACFREANQRITAFALAKQLATK